MKWLRQVWTFPVKIYQVTLSPLLGANCRFEPSCSHYMVGAVDEWGILKGTWLGIKRICRCHPWGGSGVDEVPKRDARRQI